MKLKLKPITAMVLILLVFVLAAGVWLQKDTAPEYEAGTLLPESPPRVTNAPSENRSAESVPMQPPGPEEIGPASHLPAAIADFSHLHLVGVATDLRGSFAVIYDEKRNQQGLFHSGDAVDGAAILNIGTDKVVLKHNDQVFTLMLESVSHGEKGSEPQDPADEAPPMHVLSSVDQAGIEKAWEETRELMTQIEISQNLENNEPKGVTVHKVADGSVFEKIGFQPGDVILKVDDMEISIADDALEIYNCLRTQETVQFTVRRNNEIVKLNYSVSNLTE